MKRIMLAIVLSLVLLWHCNPASAKGRPKGKGGSSSARTTRTRGKNTAAKSDRYIRPNKAAPEKASTRQKPARVEKPKAAKAGTTRETAQKSKSQKPQSQKDFAIPRVKEQKEKPTAQGKKDRPAQAESAQEEKPGKGKAKQEVKSQKKIEKAVPGNTEEKGKAKGKFHQQQQAAFQKQMLHEGQKHLKRAARLARMRVLALKQGDAKKVGRIEKLIAREQQRYGQKSQRMLGREGKVEIKAEESSSKSPG